VLELLAVGIIPSVNLSRTDQLVGIAAAIRVQRYADASIVFLAGSLVRGEGGPHSDLDLVVIYPTLPCAYRESFEFEGYPVEAFVHDPETLNYFFMEMDRPSGIPSLPQMVVEGIEIPATTDLSRRLKQRAASVIALGPPALDQRAEARLRYAITDLVNDLRDPRQMEQRIGIGAQLFEALANYFLRSRCLWSARGKAIPSALRRADADLCGRYIQSFEQLFNTGDAAPVIALAEAIVLPRGSWLFDGYRDDAPGTWRRPLDRDDE